MSNIPANKKLWEKVKKLADSVYKKPSAYKSGFMVKKYKELGGTFKKKYASKEGLSRWFAEKWVNQHGKEGYQHKNDLYRPSKKVTDKTPKTWNELSSNDVKKAKKIKYKKGRVNRF
jgi:Family of unknown function (DUF5872)